MGERGYSWGRRSALARSELARRWQALVALGVIAGLAAGLALDRAARVRRADVLRTE